MEEGREHREQKGRREERGGERPRVEENRKFNRIMEQKKKGGGEKEEHWSWRGQGRKRWKGK